jgi:hypothetical protein
MSITLNAKGTSVPYFTIGKVGTTIYQGLTNPFPTYTPNGGDYWLDSGSNNLKVWSTIMSDWTAPSLGPLTLPLTDGTNGQILITDGSGQLSFATVSGTGTVTSVGITGSSDFVISNSPITTAGNISLSLAAVGASGSHGTASAVPVFVTDSKGRVTSSSNVSILIAESQILNGTILARVADNETITGLWTFSQPVSVPDPLLGLDAANKEYVDSIASGLSIKAACRAGTVSNITLSGIQTIDAVSLNSGDRVLVMSQTTAAQNGIYVASAGVWPRSTDADTSAEVTAGMFTFVTEGTIRGGKGFVLITPNPIILGATSLTFSQFSSASGVTSVAASGGTTGLTFSGSPITTSGTLTLSGILAITNGGTGQTTANSGLNALLPTQTSNAGKFLITDGTNTSWASTAGAGGTVTTVSVVTAAGVSGNVVNPTTTPAITITLGDITPNTVAAVGTVTGSNLSGVNTGDQTITLTGDVTGSGTGTFATTLANTSVVPGPYTNANITVDSKGRITSASNGTAGTVTSVAISGGTTGLTTSGGPITTSGTITLAGTLAIANGGTSQTTANAAFNALAPTQTGNSGKVLTTDGTDTSWASMGTGTVTSVAVSSTDLSVSGSPITTSGTITLNVNNSAITNAKLANMANNTVKGNVAGISAAPTDLTATQLTTLVNVFTSSLSGAAPASGGGTVNFLRADGTWTSPSGSGSVTSVAVSGGTTGLTTSGGPITTSGTITLAGTLAIANGGTGQTTANTAFNALAPTQTGNSGKFLTTDGTNTSWLTITAGTVTSVSVVTANGVSGSVATATTTPAITLTLGDITPSSVSTPSVAITNAGSSSINTLTKTTTTSVTQTSVATFSTTSLGAAKFIVRMVQGTNIQVIELLLVTDGTTVYITQYGSVASGSDVSTFDADISGSNCRLLATPASASSTIFYVNMITL